MTNTFTHRLQVRDAIPERQHHCTKPLLMSVLLGALTIYPLSAQTFKSGSDDSYGPINITADTVLDVPPSGVFHCTTIIVAQFRTLSFRRNAMNTPVHLLATGNINIAGNITVAGSSGNNVIGGAAGPGGFDGGSPASISVAPGAGLGPGAGKGGNLNRNSDGAGAGAFATASTTASLNKGEPYGNALLIPLVGGSGGGGTTGTPGTGGGGGGGAILLASSTRIDFNGFIDTRGGGDASGTANGGSGGAIRLVAPIVAGSGALYVGSNGSGGIGRIRVDALNRSSMNLQFNPASVASIGSLMLVFPNPNPRLDIVEAAGTAILDGSGPVNIQLPFGSSPNRTIRIQARDFNAEVPITLVLTPDHGVPTIYTNKISNLAGNNPATVTLDVVLPANEQTTVNVFSK